MELSEQTVLLSTRTGVCLFLTTPCLPPSAVTSPLHTHTHTHSLAHTLTPASVFAISYPLPFAISLPPVFTREDEIQNFAVHHGGLDATAKLRRMWWETALSWSAGNKQMFGLPPKPVQPKLAEGNLSASGSAIEIFSQTEQLIMGISSKSWKILKRSVVISMDLGVLQSPKGLLSSPL